MAQSEQGSVLQRWSSKILALFRQDAVFKQDRQFSSTGHRVLRGLRLFLVEFKLKSSCNLIQKAFLESCVISVEFIEVVRSESNRNFLRMSFRPQRQCHGPTPDKVLDWVAIFRPIVNSSIAIVLVLDPLIAGEGIILYLLSFWSLFRCPMATVRHPLALELLGIAHPPRSRRKSI